MKHITLVVFGGVLLLMLLSGCPRVPKSPGNTPKGATVLTGQEKSYETSSAGDSAVVQTAPDTFSAKPKLEQQPPSKPKALPRMWDYGSTNCLPCIEMEKILKPLMSEYQGKVDIRIINVYQEQQLAKQARIQVIPTQVFYDTDGKELFRHVGVYPRDSILAKFREFGWE